MMDADLAREIALLHDDLVEALTANGVTELGWLEEQRPGDFLLALFGLPDLMYMLIHHRVFTKDERPVEMVVHEIAGTVYRALRADVLDTDGAIDLMTLLVTQRIEHGEALAGDSAGRSDTDHV